MFTIKNILLLLFLFTSVSSFSKNRTFKRNFHDDLVKDTVQTKAIKAKFRNPIVLKWINQAIVDEMGAGIFSESGIMPHKILKEIIKNKDMSLMNKLVKHCEDRELEDIQKKAQKVLDKEKFDEAKTMTDSLADDETKMNDKDLKNIVRSLVKQVDELKKALGK